MSNIKIVTSFSQAGWKTYGKRFVDSFLEHFHPSIELWMLYEGVRPKGTYCQDRIVGVDLMQIASVVKFIKAYAKHPDILAKMNTNPTKQFRWDACKFFRKVYAIEFVSHMKAIDKLFWVDADCYAFAPVTPGFMDSLLPQGYFLSHIGRKEYHSECSLMGFRTAHPAFREFMDRYKGIYATGRFLKEAEYHDSFLFDIVRREMEVEGKITSHNLTPGAGRGGHPWLVSPMASCMENCKGNLRKQAGTSFREDLEKMGVRREEDHWQKLPGKTGS